MYYFISYFTQFFNRSYIASMFIRQILNVLDTAHNIIMMLQSVCHTRQTQKSFVSLLLLFSLVCCLVIYQQLLLKSTIISVPKHSAALLTRSDNYRRISLLTSNSYYKSVDHVTVLLFGGRYFFSETILH